MGILGSVFDAFFDGLAIDVLRNSNKSTSSKKSGEKRYPSSLKAWSSKFDTTIEKDFTEYNWFDFYPSNNCHDIPALHPQAFLSSLFDDGENLTKKYLSLEKDAIMSPYDIKAQCDFIQYCFILIDLAANVKCEDDEVEYDSQYVPNCLEVEQQLYEKIHRGLCNILFYEDSSPSGQSRKCTACILDAEIYLHKGELVKCLKRYYNAFQYGVLEKSTSYGFNGWNGLQCSILANIAGIYNFAGISEKAVDLFYRFQTCISEEKKSYKELMNGFIKGSERSSQTWSAIISSLNNPSQLGFQWTYFVGSSDKLGTLYNVGNGVDGKGLPIDLNFSEICSLKIQEDKRGNQWAELQKEALNHYILNQ